jgi:hypothetical protein
MLRNKEQLINTVISNNIPFLYNNFGWFFSFKECIRALYIEQESGIIYKQPMQWLGCKGSCGTTPAYYCLIQL